MTKYVIYGRFLPTDEVYQFDDYETKEQAVYAVENIEYDDGDRPEDWTFEILEEEWEENEDWGYNEDEGFDPYAGSYSWDC